MLYHNDAEEYMEIVITHLVISAVIGISVVTLLALTVAALWGVYKLTIVGLGRIGVEGSELCKLALWRPVG